MRKVLFIAALAIGMIASAQKATYQDVQAGRMKGKIVEYTAKNGEVFKVGENITLGVPFRNENYDYIFQDAGIEYYPIGTTASGWEVRIKKIKIWKGKIYIKTTTPGGVYGLIINNFDEALEQGEVESQILSREDAIDQLKVAKDLVELEMMTEEEFDRLKEELTPVIMGSD